MDLENQFSPVIHFQFQNLSSIIQEDNDTQLPHPI